MRFQQKKHPILRRCGVIWIAGLVLLIPSLCYGQQNHPSSSTSTLSSVSSAPDDPVLKALQEMTIRAIAAEAKNELYEGRLKDKDQIIEAWKGRAENDEKQLAISDKVDTNSQRVQTVDDIRLQACQNTLAKADARIWTLEHPGLLKELFAPKELLKLGGAFWLGRATSKQ